MNCEFANGIAQEGESTCFQIFMTITKDLKYSHLRNLPGKTHLRFKFELLPINKLKKELLVIETLIDNKLVTLFVAGDICDFKNYFSGILKNLHSNKLYGNVPLVNRYDEFKMHKFVSLKLNKKNKIINMFLSNYRNDFITSLLYKYIGDHWNSDHTPVNQEIKKAIMILLIAGRKISQKNELDIEQEYRSPEETELYKMNENFNSITDFAIAHPGVVQTKNIKKIMSSNYEDGGNYIKRKEAVSKLNMIKKISQTKNCRINASNLSYRENGVWLSENCLKFSNDDYDLYYKDSEIDFCANLKHAYIDSTVLQTKDNTNTIIELESNSYLEEPISDGENEIKKNEKTEKTGKLIVTVSTIIKSLIHPDKIKNDDPDFYEYKTFVYFVFKKAHVRKTVTLKGKFYKRTTITNTEYKLIFEFMKTKFLNFKSITSDFEGAITKAANESILHNKSNILIWGCIPHFNRILSKNCHVSKQCKNIAKQMPFFNFTKNDVKNCDLKRMMAAIGFSPNDRRFINRILAKYFNGKINFFNRGAFEDIEDQIEAFKLTNNAAERPNKHFKSIKYDDHCRTILEYIDYQLHTQSFVGRPKKKPKHFKQNQAFKNGMFVSSQLRFALRGGHEEFIRLCEVYIKKNCKNTLQKTDENGNCVFVENQNNSSNVNDKINIFMKSIDTPETADEKECEGVFVYNSTEKKFIRQGMTIFKKTLDNFAWTVFADYFEKYTNVAVLKENKVISIAILHIIDNHVEILGFGTRNDSQGLGFDEKLFKKIQEFGNVITVASEKEQLSFYLDLGFQSFSKDKEMRHLLDIRGDSRSMFLKINSNINCNIFGSNIPKPFETKNHHLGKIKEEKTDATMNIEISKETIPQTGTEFVIGSTDPAIISQEKLILTNLLEMYTVRINEYFNNKDMIHACIIDEMVVVSVCVILVSRENKQAEIIAFGTKEDSQRKGYGSNLIQLIKTELINLGIGFLTVYSNDEALEFYLQRGFSKFTSKTIIKHLFNIESDLDVSLVCKLNIKNKLSPFDNKIIMGNYFKREKIIIGPPVLQEKNVLEVESDHLDCEHKIGVKKNFLSQGERPQREQRQEIQSKRIKTTEVENEKLKKILTQKEDEMELERKEKEEAKKTAEHERLEKERERQRADAAEERIRQLEEAQMSILSGSLKGIHNLKPFKQKKGFQHGHGDFRS